MDPPSCCGTSTSVNQPKPEDQGSQAQVGADNCPQSFLILLNHVIPETFAATVYNQTLINIKKTLT
jgi:hypothetical protein